MSENAANNAANGAMPEQSKNGGDAEARRSAGRFKPGNPGYGLRRRKKGSRTEACRIPRLLRDMRHVYRHEESRDRTPGHRLCRQLMKEDAKAFMAQMIQLERTCASGAKDQASDSGVAKLAPPEERDEGTERAIGVAEHWLAERAARRAESRPVAP
jgi:hypothetical protein